MSALDVYWWSPRHSARTFAGEVKEHGVAWARLASPIRRAFTNFGDELNEQLMAEITGRRIRWAPLGREDVVAVGSVLVPYLTRGGKGLIWGSGINRDASAAEVSRLDPARVLALRGPKTIATLGVSADTPQGDPGLLVRALQTRPIERRGRIVIPHFTVFQRSESRARLRELARGGYDVVLPTSTPDEMMRRILGAQEVATTGMHGLILSHALRTPARLVTLADPPSGSPAFKYQDYFASVRLAPHLVPARDLLEGDGVRVQAEEARKDLAQVDGRIDELINGLLASVKPLK